MTPITESRPGNHLLESLPREDYASLAAHLEPVSLARSTVLHQPGDIIREHYFPINSLISVTVTMRDGRSAETGLVGKREVSGMNAFLESDATTQTDFVVQVPGEAMRIPADILRAEFERRKGVRDILLRHTQAMIAQISQNVACNRLHSLEQRYARWLLEVRDRISSDELALTHKYIAIILGVRRASVTEVSGKFESAGILKTRRGRTWIVDAERLRKASCECHESVSGEYERLFGETASAHSQGGAGGSGGRSSGGQVGWLGS